VRSADVAQLVEQLIRNQQVVSSSLTVGSMRSGKEQVDRIATSLSKVSGYFGDLRF
jgi:hypothetical protein